MVQRGMIVIGWNDWFGSCYFPCIPKPYFTDGHPDDVDLQEAEAFGAEMMKRSRRITAGETSAIPVFPRGEEYDELYNPLTVEMRRRNRHSHPTQQPGESVEESRRKFTRVTSVEFKVDAEKCRYPKCTFCIDNCPMNAIDFSVTPPLFNRDCDRCYLCEMTCPNGAIEYDYEPLQVVHGNDTAVPQLMKSLEIFEARGKFRRLVLMDEIGWDTPLYRFPRPRYKVVE
jgi:Fe-S-cluster-containing hydrogenase component 2